jgi:type IV pilus assembly protein PilM
MANFFSKIFSSEGSSGQSALGIDIGSSSIKVVQLTKKGGKAILETYGSLALGTYGSQEVGRVMNLNAEDLSRATLDLLKEASTTTHLAGVAIPSSSSLVFTISLPGLLSEDQLKSIIPNEARKYIPVPITEVTLDWSLIPQQAKSEPNANATQNDRPIDQKTDVLVVAIHNETVSRFKEVLQKTELETSFFEMEIFSTIRSTFNREFAPVILLDFGASKTKLSIVEYGIVRVFHIINRGSQDLTLAISQALSIPFADAELRKRNAGLDASLDKEVADVVKLGMDYILSEANSVVLTYEKKYNKAISKVILCGGGARTLGFLKYATDNFHREVAYGNPFGKTEAPAFLTPVLETSGPEFAAAVGLALRQIS